MDLLLDHTIIPDRSPVGRFPEVTLTLHSQFLTLTTVYINLPLSVLIWREHLFLLTLTKADSSSFTFNIYIQTLGAYRLTLGAYRLFVVRPECTWSIEFVLGSLGSNSHSEITSNGQARGASFCAWVKVTLTHQLSILGPKKFSIWFRNEY